MKKNLVFIISILLVALAVSSCNDKKRILFRTEEKNSKVELDSVIIDNVQAPPVLKMKPSDIITVTIGSKTQLSNVPFIGTFDIPVDYNGIVKIPQLGDFVAVNKTIVDFEQELKDSVSKILESPQVLVSLKQYNIEVLGSVYQPGIIQVYGGASINIVHAIGLAGNINENGNAQQIKVLRQEGNQLKAYTIDLTTLDAFNSNVLYLQSGDVVYVPKIKALNILKVTTVVSSLSILLNAIILLSTRL